MLLSILAVSSMPCQAEPVRRASPLGGGFIELLMTGRTQQNIPQPAPQQAQPYMAQPYTPQPIIQPYDPPIQPKREATHQARIGYSTPPSMASPMPMADPSPNSIEPQNHTPATAKTAKQFDKQEVAYKGDHAPGTIVIDTPNKFLYLVQANGRALRYGIGVGRPGFEWAGVKQITRKREWPDWRPPPEMLKRRPDLPRYMEGGIENPLGARALYLGSSLYRIHGTNEPQTIGRAVSSGCIRMKNDDVADLYERVGVGTKVIVI